MVCHEGAEPCVDFALARFTVAPCDAASFFAIQFLTEPKLDDEHQTGDQHNVNVHEDVHRVDFDCVSVPTGIFVRFNALVPDGVESAHQGEKQGCDGENLEVSWVFH